MADDVPVATDGGPRRLADNARVVFKDKPAARTFKGV